MAKATTTNPFWALGCSVWQLATLLRLLTRAELSAMVALSATAGYLFAGPGTTASGLLVAGGIWLLAAGCSALNQWQEQDLDVRMVRTCRRPLPAGKLLPGEALLLSLLLSAGGLVCLGLSGLKPLLLGGLALIWYNGIYTPLKRRTPFAALPGALCGALPPLIGWSAAGRPLLAGEILILAGTLFIWQIPHTWLLLCRYRHDLQRSGLPNLFETISTRHLLRINHCWLAALGFCYLLFPLFGLISQQGLQALYLIGQCLIAVSGIRTLRKTAADSAPTRLFHLVNLSMALLLLTLILDNLSR